MILEDIFNLEGTIVTEEKFNKVMQSEFMAFFQNCGASGLKTGYTWSILTLIDGREVNIYCKTV